MRTAIPNPGQECIGCEVCDYVCGYEAIEVFYDPQHDYFFVTVNVNNCIGCEACIGACPVEALIMSN